MTPRFSGTGIPPETTLAGYSFGRLALEAKMLGYFGAQLDDATQRHHDEASKGITPSPEVTNSDRNRVSHDGPTAR
jgi:hypothetical protein